MKIDIFERGDNNIDRNLRDKLQAAQRANPEVSDPYQALALQNVKQLEKSERDHFQQNKVINAQRRELNKLQNTISDFNQELQSIESRSKDTDDEVNQIRNLSRKLQGDFEQQGVERKEVQDMLKNLETMSGKFQGEINQQGVERNQVRDMLKQLETLRDKPGMDTKEFEKLKQDVEAKLKNPSGVDPEKFARLEKYIQQLETTNGGITDEQLEQLKRKADEIIKTKIGTIEKQLSSVTDKEIKKMMGNLLDYVNHITRPYDKKIDGLEDKLLGTNDTIEKNIRPKLEKQAEFQQDIIKSQERTSEELDDYRTSLDRERDINSAQEEQLSDLYNRTNLKKPEYSVTIRDKDDIQDKNFFDQEIQTQLVKGGSEFTRNAVYNFSQQADFAKKRINNLLATHYVSGNEQKSKKQDLQKVKLEIANLINYSRNIARDLAAEVEKSEAYELDEYTLMDVGDAFHQMEKAIAHILKIASNKTNINWQDLVTPESKAFIDSISKTHGEAWFKFFPDQKHKKGSVPPKPKAHLPESYDLELTLLAENILGPELSRFLK
jgi:hypothetical protein